MTLEYNIHLAYDGGSWLATSPKFPTLDVRALTPRYALNIAKASICREVARQLEQGELSPLLSMLVFKAFYVALPR